MVGGWSALGHAVGGTVALIDLLGEVGRTPVLGQHLAGGSVVVADGLETHVLSAEQVLLADRGVLAGGDVGVDGLLGEIDPLVERDDLRVEVFEHLLLLGPVDLAVVPDDLVTLALGVARHDGEDPHTDRHEDGHGHDDEGPLEGGLLHVAGRLAVGHGGETAVFVELHGLLLTFCDASLVWLTGVGNLSSA